MDFGKRTGLVLGSEEVYQSKRCGLQRDITYATSGGTKRATTLPTSIEKSSPRVSTVTEPRRWAQSTQLSIEKQRPIRAPKMAPAAEQSRQVRAKMTGKTPGPTK